MGMAPTEMAVRVGQGLLAFPVTHFTEDLSFDEERFREHCAWLAGHNPAGLFAAGGTGEFFSLTAQEVKCVTAVAVQEVGGRLPVLGGCGHGTAVAKEIAREAEQAGADGILLLPPYLVNAGQDGLAAHVEAVCKATGLGVIVYNRDNAVLTAETLARLCDRNPNLIGFKDGVGDIELMMRIRCTLGDRLIYIGGLPTAETFAPAYLAMGVSTYSSAIFNFMPEWARAFHADVRAGRNEAVEEKLKSFVFPYIALRDRGRGYAVSIVKAGMAAVGRPAGPVRPPLTDLTPPEQEQLVNLVHRVCSSSLAGESLGM